MRTADTRPQYHMTFLAIAGALPWLISLPLYRLWARASGQLSLPRAIGLFAVIALMLLAVAAVLALWRSRLDRPKLGRWATLLLLAGALGNLAFVGLYIFVGHIRVTPSPPAWLAAGGWLLFMANFLRYQERELAFVGRAIQGLGLSALIAPLLCTPWVLYDASHDRPTFSDGQDHVASATKPIAPKRIVLVTFDGLRAQSTSLMQHALTTTPALKSLEKEATYFSRCYAAADHTLTSIPAILSGVPVEAFFVDQKNRATTVRDGFLPSVGAYLRSAGYQSYFATAFIEPNHFGFRGGFRDGQAINGLFDENRFNTRAYLPLSEAFLWAKENITGQKARHIAVQPLEVSRHTLTQALSYMAKPGPTFLWVHLAAPHAPYWRVALDELDGKSPPRALQRVGDEDMAKADEAKLREYEGVYEDYIRFTDAEFGRFLGEMKRQGLYEDTMLIVTSDHGESFGTEDRGHANGHLSEPITRVPLLVRLPGQHRAERVDRVVSHVDLVPTILASVYQDPPKLAGQPLLNAAPPEDRIVSTWGLSFHLLGQHDGYGNYAAYDRGYKYLLEATPHGQKEYLYDLARDPEATEDILDQAPEVAARMRKEVAHRTGMNIGQGKQGYSPTVP